MRWNRMRNFQNSIKMAKVLLDDRHALRACFLYEFLHGHKAATAHRNICQVLGEGALTYDMVKYWFRRFKHGDYNLEDKPTTSRSRSGVVNNIKEELEKEFSIEWEIPSVLGLTRDVVHSRPTESGAVENESAIHEWQNAQEGPTLICVKEEAVVAPSESEMPTLSCVKEEAVVAPIILRPDSDRKDSTLLLSLSSDSAEPSSSKEARAPAQGLRLSKSPYHIGHKGKLFHGVVEASKRGVYPVIRYTLPDGEYCYVFEQVRITKKGKVVYRCTTCRKKGTSTSIAVKNGCDFIGDPALLPHVCTPLKNAQDRVTRLMYQSCQAIASDPQLAEAKPNQLWKSIARFIDDNAPEDETQRKLMLKHFYRSGYKSRRTTIARAAAKLHRAAMKKRAEEWEDRTSKTQNQGVGVRL